MIERQPQQVPQVAHVNVQLPCVLGGRSCIHHTIQGARGQQLAPVAHQVKSQRPFLRRQMHRDSFQLKTLAK